MKKRFTRIMTLVLALAMIVLAFAACGEDPDKPNGPGEQVASDYQYYTDHKGASYRILNVNEKQMWGMITCLDYVPNPNEKQDEVRLNIYTRNQKVKNNMNCDIVEVVDETVTEYQMNRLLSDSILSGNAQSSYDAAFMPMYHAGTMVPSKYYQCLNDISTLHLDQTYWDSAMLSSTSVGGKNYFATGDVHMMAFESMWCLFFNKNMMEDKDMAYPYQLVDEGKWTFEEFSKYCKKAMNLNGDKAFSKESENAIFGCVSFDSIIAKMILGMGTSFVKKDSNDVPVPNIEDKSFNSVCQTIEDFLNTNGAYLMADDDIKSDYYYENYFTREQCMFLGAEIKAAQGYRDTIQDWQFGIVPIPTNNAGDPYRSTSTYQTCAYVVPVNNKQPDKVSNVVDALGFESNAIVIQPYFTKTVEQKGLKDDDSVRMLNKIRDNRTYDIGAAFNWTHNFEKTLANMLADGDTNVAAAAKREIDKIQAEITRTMNGINE